MTEKAAIIINDPAKLLAVPNKLLNRDIEKTVATTVAPRIAKTPLSNTFGRHANRPLETSANNQAIKPVPATANTSKPLFISKTFVVHGKNNKGIKKTPTINAHRTIV